MQVEPEARMEWFVSAPDGRTLAVEDAGDRDGRAARSQAAAQPIAPVMSG